MKLLSIIVPCFNEEEVIEETHDRLISLTRELDMDFEIIYIDDGSYDKTMQKLRNFASESKHVRIISFSRNFGHQNAITAGMDHANGDAIVVIDADLQDPVNVIPEMIEKWRKGFEVVYGKRTYREGEPKFKKISAKSYYRILNLLSERDIPNDVGDFRLIDKKVLEALKKMPEHSRYVRGLVSWLGFRITYVEFVREPRFAGNTKYPFIKMIKLAFDGIFSFSYKPLRLASLLGSIVSLGSFCYLLYVLYLGIFTHKTIMGWTSTMAVMLFLSGIVLLVLGIIGEYIGRIYEEVKSRPIYVISEIININNSNVHSN